MTRRESLTQPESEYALVGRPQGMAAAIGGPVSCAVRPATSHETTLDSQIPAPHAIGLRPSGACQRPGARRDGVGGEKLAKAARGGRHETWNTAKYRCG